MLHKYLDIYDFRLAWSAEEAGKILETYKAFENKPPDMIMEKQNVDPHSKLIEVGWPESNEKSICKNLVTLVYSGFDHGEIGQ